MDSIGCTSDPCHPALNRAHKKRQLTLPFFLPALVPVEDAATAPRYCPTLMTTTPDNALFTPLLSIALIAKL